MAILVITVNMQRCRCKEKIDKILNCLRCKHCIEKIEYEGEKVIVRGSFCAEELRTCIWRKAGCKIIVNIIIVEVWPPPPPPPPVVNVNVKADVTATAIAAAEAAAKATAEAIIEVGKEHCKPPGCKMVPYPYPVPYPMGASILVITVDLKCCRCRAKITKVLDCLKGELTNIFISENVCDAYAAEYCIEKTEFEDKDDKVIVRGKFDAGNLRNKIYCKAGGKVVKEIKIVDAWPPPKAPEKKKDEKPVCKLVPFPVPYPAPPPACGGAQGSPPWCCPPNQQCYYCCPAPPPPPPKPKPCECTHCHGGGCNKPVPPCGGGCSSDGGACGASKPPPAIWPPQPSFYYYPPPCGGYKFACEENSDVCAIM
uniref:HMA domain-containing protein n=1 Tax=Oryza punctata TaxID=4537 RepID=A0A0E0KQ19_ORYPU